MVFKVLHMVVAGWMLGVAMVLLDGDIVVAMWLQGGC